MTSDTSYTAWYFLGGVIALSGILFVVDTTKIMPVLLNYFSLLKQILPTILLVLGLMILTNYFIEPKKLVKYMGENSKKRSWLVAIGTGIISTGPIYLWYPLLNDLQKHGMRNGLIATFLYARSIKIPLFPLLVAYFGVTYTVVLTLSILLVSIPQGIAVEFFMQKIHKTK